MKLLSSKTNKTTNKFRGQFYDIRFGKKIHMKCVMEKLEKEPTNSA